MHRPGPLCLIETMRCSCGHPYEFCGTHYRVCDPGRLRAHLHEAHFHEPAPRWQGVK